MTQFRPMKAETAEIAKLRFPLILQPKLDGVRALNVNGRILSRTLKPFGNRRVNEFFSRPVFAGLDGEFWLENDSGPVSPSLCRDTTSALNSHSGVPRIHWTIFDKSNLAGESYLYRYEAAKQQVLRAIGEDPALGDILHLIPNAIAYDHDDVLRFEEHALSDGYEGVILRQPDSLYKYGRSTANSQELLRIKRFVDEEAVVTGIIEAQHNGNAAEISELGYLKRSSHSENKTGNGMLGAIEILYRGTVETIGPGEMPHSDRIRFFQNPELLIGRTITFKHFPHGAKSKLRMASFKHIRDNSI